MAVAGRVVELCMGPSSKDDGVDIPEEMWSCANVISKKLKLRQEPVKKSQIWVVVCGKNCTCSCCWYSAQIE